VDSSLRPGRRRCGGGSGGDRPDDPEEALKALIAVDPEDDPELSDEDVQKIVRGGLTDPESDTAEDATNEKSDASE